jgi:hypothetical protein
MILRARAQSPTIIHHNSEVDRFPDFTPGQPSNGERGEMKGSFHDAEHAAAQEIERELQGLGEDARGTMHHSRACVSARTHARLATSRPLWRI